MSNVYLPLVPETKRPAVEGWADPEYAGVTPEPGGWYGLRADAYVIVDCDSTEAARSWREAHPETTCVVQTPRGFHFYYLRTPGAPEAPAVNVLPGTDIRAGRGSYVVWSQAPGYRILGYGSPRAFDPAWAKDFRKRADVAVNEADTWTTVPEGQRNSTLTAIGGTLRKQGMATPEVARTLAALNHKYLDPPLDLDEVKQIARSVCRYGVDPETDHSVEWTTSTAEVQWASKLKLPPPPEWWWRPYFPAGRLVFMDGREGIGKGMFATFLAMCVTKGVTPAGKRVKPSNVLWLPTEDDPEEDILRRLYAAGYDDQPGDVGFIGARLKLPVDEQVLRDAIRESQCRFVILDPGRAYLGVEDGQSGREFSYNNEAHVRPGMESLIRIGKETGATILFIHHWNKDSKGDIFYRQAGSGAFNQIIRHRITIARVEHEGEVDGAFAVTKSNLAEPGHVHGYTLDTVPELDTAKFVLRGAMPEWASLDEWYKAAQEQRAEDVLMRPHNALYTHLAFTLKAGDPIPSRDALAEELGLPTAQVKQALGVLATEGRLMLTPGKPTIWQGEG